MDCWITNPAAGVTRNSQPETPDGNTFITDSRNGSTTTTITVVIAAALRHMTAPTATANTATTATSAAVQAATLMSVSAEVGSRNWPWFSFLGTPSVIAMIEAARPVTNATAPNTTALAASTGPRRGIAASVTRIARAGTRR